MLHVFSTRECIIEGHIGLPLVHWFPSQSKMRYTWAWLTRKLGFGFGWGINTKPDSEWLNEALDWVDHYVFYRNWEAIEQCFSRLFDVESYTRPQLAFHLSNKRGMAPRLLLFLLRYAPAALVLERLQWRRHGHAILCRSRKQE